MRTEGSASDRRRTIRRALGGSIGAGTIALLMLASTFASAGVGHPMLFAGASWTPSGSRTFSGCGNSATSNPSFSISTGIGHWGGRSSASSCPASRGGSAADSAATSAGSLTVTVPLSLSGGKGGVNVSWTLQLSGSDTGVGHSASACPVTAANFSYNYGYTWLNGSYSYSYCYVYASVDLYGYSYLYDSTSGIYSFPSNAWAGIYNLSGMAFYNYSESYGYSNPSYWTYNASYSYNASSSSGAHASVSGTYVPQWFINGTFRASHSYTLTTYVYGYTYAAEGGFSNASASAHLNLATRGNHETLNPIVTW